MAHHALISGAGIAGPALAHQLAARGWKTTVVERFPQRRDEGQNVDIRGTAREVVRRMGIESDVRAANTGEIGTRFLKGDGSPAVSFPVDSSGETDGPTAELEILRGELSRILIDHTVDTTDYRFDTEIAAVADHGDHITAALQDGSDIDADVLVIAEGLRSRSRRFVTAEDVNELGMYFAYITIPRSDTDDRWWNWQHETNSRGIHLRPDNLGTTRAILTFMADVRGLEELDQSDQITILKRTFDGVGGAAPRILAELDAGAPMYFSAVGQLSNRTWIKGRIVLLGDAASCNATFGGAGTSLALIGGYVLAGELAAAADVPSALAQYQRVMQPFADAAPRVRADVLRRANPRTRTGIRVLHTGARVAASRVVQTIAAVTGKGLVNIANSAPLPDYPTVDVRLP